MKHWLEISWISFLVLFSFHLQSFQFFSKLFITGKLKLILFLKNRLPFHVSKNLLVLFSIIDDLKYTNFCGFLKIFSQFATTNLRQYWLFWYYFWGKIFQICWLKFARTFSVTKLLKLFYFIKTDYYNQLLVLITLIQFIEIKLLNLPILAYIIFRKLSRLKIFWELICANPTNRENFMSTNFGESNYLQFFACNDFCRKSYLKEY